MTAFADGYFDLVTAVEILEHLEHPEQALAEMRRVLKPNGILILSVPADPKLWSERDVRLGHFRRYRLAELTAAVANTGFEILKASYANAFYYWPARILLPRSGKGTGPARQDTFAAPPLLAALYTAILKLETQLILHGRLPWGVSAVCVAKKSKA
jgi:SAM-dependent methyltransferase